MAATTARRKTTTEKGLGWRHQQAVEGLKRRHVDGSPCEWCGKPMWLDPTKNWDYNPDVPYSGGLHGDHGDMTRAEAQRLGLPPPLPNRLLHGRCNNQRGDGINDHLAVVNQGKRTTEGKTDPATTTGNTDRAMPWPW